MESRLIDLSKYRYEAAQEQIEDSEKIMETIKVYLEKRWNTDK